MFFTKKNISLLIQLILVTGVFAYVVIRANSLSFTHDEAFSYKFLIGQDDPQVTANHHILNTQLMGVSKSLFGKSELALRLPNVLAFLLFAAGYFLITTRTKIKHSWLLFALYFFNPFVLDFFSLARGYGLSMGFVSISLYGSLRLNQSEIWISFRKYTVLAFLFATLALFSNLSAVNFYLVLLGYVLLIFFKKEFFQLPKKQVFVSIILFLLFLLPLYVAIDRLLYLKDLNELYFGADSLWDSLGTFAANTIYSAGYPEFVYNGIQYIIFIFFLIGVVVLFFRIKKFYEQDVLLIFPVMILGFYIEYIVFGAKFPMGRTTLFLYVIFLIYVARFFTFPNKPKLKLPFQALSIVGSMALFIHFFNVANITKTANWGYDSYTSVVMKEIKKISKEKQASFSANWLFEPAVNYYIEYYEIDMPRIDRRGVRDSTEYIYEFEKELNDSLFQVVKKYDVSETVFAKKKTREE